MPRQRGEGLKEPILLLSLVLEHRFSNDRSLLGLFHRWRFELERRLLLWGDKAGLWLFSLLDWGTIQIPTLEFDVIGARRFYAHASIVVRLKYSRLVHFIVLSIIYKATTVGCNHLERRAYAIQRREH